MRAFFLGFAASLALATGARAEAPIAVETCQRGWQAFSEATGQSGRIINIQPFVNMEGWCQIDRSIADLRANDFGALVWRATGVDAAVNQRGLPESIEAEFTGIDLVEGFNMDLPPERAGALGELRLSAVRNSETLAFQVEDVTFDFGTLGQATLRVEGGGIDLSGLNRMQSTLGGLRVYEARVFLRTTPDLTRALAGGPESRAMLQGMVALLPDAALTEGTGPALAAFLDQADRTGDLAIVLSSQEGLGAAQVVGAVMRFDEGADDIAAMQAMLEQMLTGVRLTARWTPDP